MNLQYRLPFPCLAFFAGCSEKSVSLGSLSVSLGSLQVSEISEQSAWFVGGLVLAAPAVVDAAAIDAATAVWTEVGSLLNSQIESPLVISLLISADRNGAGVVVPQLLEQHCTEVGSLFNPLIESPLVYFLLIFADRIASFKVAANAVGTCLIAARVLIFVLLKCVLNVSGLA